MRRSLVGIAVPLLIMSGLVPAVAGRKAESQVVVGRVLLPDLGSLTPPMRPLQCDGRIPRRLDSSIRRTLNGSLVHEFDVSPETWRHGFELQVLDSAGDVNLDIAFWSPAGVGYSTVRAGGEVGVVPSGATRGMVCLASGAAATFRYEAGPSIEPPSLEAETAEADHSANLRLRGREVTPDGVRRLVFQGDEAFSSSVNGLNTFRLLPRPPFIRHVGHLYCPGGAPSADLSVWGDYVFQSVPQEYPYASMNPINEYNWHESDRCNNTDDSHEAGGIRVVDVSDLRQPRQVKFFKTPCGSMNHTVIPHREKLYIYAPTPCEENFPDLPRDIRPLNYQIQVLRFDPRNVSFHRVATPRLDGQMGCHDITVFPSANLAACPQFFNEVGRVALLDIEDPLNPKVLSHMELPAESTWMAHAAFTWDGRYLVLADTGGAMYVGDRRAACSGAGTRSFGAVWIYDIADRRAPRHVGSYTLPRSVPSSTGIVCAPWEVNIIPTRDPKEKVAVVGWNNGGLTVVDLSDATRPREFAHWQPPQASQTMGAYFYNGKIYAVEFWTGTGVRVFDLEGFGREETKTYSRRMNPQTQLTQFRR